MDINHSSCNVMGFHTSTLVVRGANTQLSARLTYMCVYVLLNACLNHAKLAIDRAGEYPSIACMWATGHAVCVVIRQNSQNNAILALNSIERPATFHRRAVDDFKHPFWHRSRTPVVGPPVDVPSAVNVH